ncbi:MULTISPECIES: transposase [Nocardia]|uniref:transposase n=1 Tax=Nocardia TaxID=1817 RepID=UPI0015EFBF63|nr:transposase [Nocardia rosealba]MCA2205441.1 transposase [Nocardia rosealba]
MTTTIGDPVRVLTDAQWALLEMLLPTSAGRAGRDFANNRLVIEGMLFWLRSGIVWRELPAEFGPWQTVWKRQRRYQADGTWDRLLTALAAMADDAGNLAWMRRDI